MASRPTSASGHRSSKRNNQKLDRANKSNIESKAGGKHDYANSSSSNNNTEVNNRAQVSESGEASDSLDALALKQQQKQNKAQLPVVVAAGGQHAATSSSSSSSSNSAELSWRQVCAVNLPKIESSSSSSDIFEREAKVIGDHQPEDFEVGQLGGENCRCNCSGRKRSTLAGLIEFYEQQVRVAPVKPNESVREEVKLESSGAARQRIKRAKGKSKSPSRDKINYCHHNHHHQHHYCHCCSFHCCVKWPLGCWANKTGGKSKSEGRGGAEMRDIITQVKYEPNSATTTTDSASEETDYHHEEEDGETFNGDSGDLGAGCDGIERDKKSTETSRSREWQLKRRIARKGVRVLPRNVPSGPIKTTTSTPRETPVVLDDLQRRLTALRWQPPTDGSQYLAPATRLRNSSSNTNSRKASPSWAATRGPPIVRHQKSSSRRLLSQLARLRRLSEPAYRIKRPEKVAEVENLIEQLERLTQELDEDEHLLDRAERRDWPQEYHKRFSAGASERVAVSAEKNIEEPTAIMSFGERDDIHPIEVETIERSHTNLKPSSGRILEGDDDMKRQGASHSSRTITSKSTTVSQKTSTSQQTLVKRPSAFPDKYTDDLAIRRINSNQHQANNNNIPSGRPTSYLLYSGAYTPTIERQASQVPRYGNYKVYETDLNDLDDEATRRLHQDDLHYRSVRPKPVEPEPPFGVPRSQFRQQQHVVQATPNFSHTQRQRPDSRVSFVDEEVNQATGAQTRPISSKSNASGFASADSGLAGNSPISRGGTVPRSASTRLAASSPLRGSNATRSPSEMSYGDLEQEIDIEAELRAAARWSGPSFVGREESRPDSGLAVGRESSLLTDSAARYLESPAVEKHKAALLNTPTRRRPRIDLQNPRAKSPLLRVSSEVSRQKSSPDGGKVGRQDEIVKVECYEDTLRRRRRAQQQQQQQATGELACHYDFSDEEEEDAEANSRQTRPKSRYTDYEEREPEVRRVSGGSSSQNESWERLNYRGVEFRKSPEVSTSGMSNPKSTTPTANRMIRRTTSEASNNMRPPRKSSTPFSIGEYKSCSKDLKIL